MESGRLLLLLPWRAADDTHTLRAGRKAGGVRAPAPIRRQFLGKEREGENVREREGGCSVQTPFVSSKTLRNRVYAAQVIYIKVVVLRSLYLFQSGYLDQKCKFPEI